MEKNEKECFEDMLKNNRLTALYLSCCCCRFQRFDVAEVLENCFPFMMSLHALHIYRIPVTESDKLEKVLRSCHHLQNLESFQLKDLRLFREGKKLLSKALGQLKNLKRLSLFGVCLSEELCHGLLSSIRECRSLTFLQLSNVGIGDANIADLGDLCLQMESLETLDLRYNSISADAMRRLHKQLETDEKSKSLTLRLDKNPGCDCSEVIKKLQGVFKWVSH
jgi:Ran GTPase-activating protein (RanGAP) involved in mRNA processing and transport